MVLKQGYESQPYGVTAKGQERSGAGFYCPPFVRAVSERTFSYKEPPTCAQNTSEPGSPAWSLSWSPLCFAVIHIILLQTSFNGQVSGVKGRLKETT